MGFGGLLPNPLTSIQAALRAPGLRHVSLLCGPLHLGHTWRCVKGTFTGQLSGRVLREQATTGLPDAGRAPRSNSMVCGPEGATTAGPPSVIRGRERRRRRYRHAARRPESAAAGQLGSVHSGVAIRTTRSLDHGNHSLWFSGGHELPGTGGPAVLKWQRLDQGHHLLAQRAQPIQFPRPSQLVGGAQLLGRLAGAYAGIADRQQAFDVAKLQTQVLRPRMNRSRATADAP